MTAAETEVPKPIDQGSRSPQMPLSYTLLSSPLSSFHLQPALSLLFPLQLTG